MRFGVSRYSLIGAFVKESYIRGMELNFRKSEPEDCELYFVWANEPGSRQNSLNSDEITWKDHQAWFEERLQDQDTLMLLFFNGNLPVGQVRFQKKGEEYHVGISVAQDNRGKGLGQKILSIATEEFVRQFQQPALAQIKPENKSSIKIFEAARYELATKTSKFLEYKYLVGY